MEPGCEHTEGSPIGKCAICDRTVCSDCYRDVFNSMICDLHQELEDEAEWELVGFYSETSMLVQRRYALEENGITSLVTEPDEESIELYVPGDERDDAFEALKGLGEETVECSDCQIQFSLGLGACPVCGVKSVQVKGEG
ncbi:MAG: hypothetical protein ACE5EO_05230 [Candidatus Krumholzibacteriia bacterium]